MNSSEFYKNNKDTINISNNRLYKNNSTYPYEDSDKEIDNVMKPSSLNTYECAAESNVLIVHDDDYDFFTGEFNKLTSMFGQILPYKLDNSFASDDNQLLFIAHNKDLTYIYWLTGKNITEPDYNEHNGNYFLFAKHGGTIQHNNKDYKCMIRFKENSKLVDRKPTITYTFNDDDLTCTFVISVYRIEELPKAYPDVLNGN